MTSVVPDNIAELLSKYDLKVNSPKTGDNLYCIVCYKLLNDAHISPCECHYCLACIIKYLSLGNTHCCGVKDGCKDEELVVGANVCRSSALNKKIQKTIVQCPYDMCTHSDQLVKMFEHLSVCSKRPIQCPYLQIGCQHDNLKKDELSFHLSDAGLSHSELLISMLNQTKNEVTELINTFQIKMESFQLDMQQKAEQIMNLIEQVTILSTENEVLKQNVQRLHNLSTNAPVEPQHRSLTFVSSDSLTASEETLSTENDALKQNVHQINNLSTNAPVELQHQSSTFVSLEPLGATRSRSIPSERKYVSQDVDVFNNFKFVITNFTDKKIARQNVYSSYFYSHTKGYKIRLRVYPNGHLVNGRYVSVYFIICKGEYDEELLWPFPYSFEISIINDKSGPVHTQSYKSADTTYEGTAFDKPSDKDNNGFGFPKFIAINDLQLFINNNDSVVIQCDIKK